MPVQQVDRSWLSIIIMHCHCLDGFLRPARRIEVSYTWPSTCVSIAADARQPMHGLPHACTIACILDSHCKDPLWPAGLLANIYANKLMKTDPTEAAKLRCWAQKQLRYIVGDAGRSFVVGMGNNPPSHSHHRGASCPKRSDTCDWTTGYNPTTSNPHTLYGALIGGPHVDDSFKDTRDNFEQNEPALDFNAGYTGAFPL